MKLICAGKVLKDEGTLAEAGVKPKEAGGFVVCMITAKVSVRSIRGLLRFLLLTPTIPYARPPLRRHPHLRQRQRLHPRSRLRLRPRLPLHLPPHPLPHPPRRPRRRPIRSPARASRRPSR